MRGKLIASIFHRARQQVTTSPENGILFRVVKAEQRENVVRLPFPPKEKAMSTIDHATQSAFPQDDKSAGTTWSGYRVIEQGGYIPLAIYPRTPTGLRQAITYAQTLGRSDGDTYDMFNRYVISDLTITAIVQEYHLTTRDILVCSPVTEPFEKEDPNYSRIAVDQNQALEPILFHGYWPFWNSVFKSGTASEHDLTEEDAVQLTREMETRIRKTIADHQQSFIDSLRRLPNPTYYLWLILTMSQDSEKPLTAKRVLRRIDKDEVDWFADLERLVNAFTSTKEETLLAARQNIFERLPSAVQKTFMEDVSRFFDEELTQSVMDAMPIS